MYIAAGEYNFEFFVGYYHLLRYWVYLAKYLKRIV